MQEWCTIESDPGVFTELINNIGVQGVQVEEIYDLNDEPLIENMQPIYGLIFLFRWTSKGEKRECLKIYDQDLFFANQVIQNACATQAIISILLNRPEIEIGATLSNYKEFAIDLDPKSRGISLGNLEVIRIAHNSFARPEPFITKSKKKAREGDDVFHFVSYVPFKGGVYELDGLQEGPILIGNFEQDWVAVAREAILKRVALYQEKEVAFTLLAVNQSRVQKAQRRLEQLQVEQGALLKSLQQQGVELSAFQLSELQKVEQKLEIQQEGAEVLIKEELEKQLNTVMEQISDQMQLIQNENQKLESYKLENARRRHNYIPFILELFKVAHSKGQLEGLIEGAKQKQQQRQAQKK